MSAILAWISANSTAITGAAGVLYGVWSTVRGQAHKKRADKAENTLAVIHSCKKAEVRHAGVHGRGA